MTSRPRTVGIVQARMSSSRLPGKMAAEIIAGRSTLDCVLERLQRSRAMDAVMLATSDEPDDDRLAEIAGRRGVQTYRGSLDDVLGRVVGAADTSAAEVVVELTGDCPLICPEVVDRVVDEYHARRREHRLVANNIVSTHVASSYPKGQDARVVSRADLAEIARISDDPAHHEHPTLYFFEHPDTYRPFLVEAPRKYNRPDWRMLLDYPEDLAFIRAVYARLYPVRPAFDLDDLFALLEREPALLDINRHCGEKAVR